MREERGQALIETILIALILLVPLVWLLMTLAEMHRAALATTAAVREAGTDAARASTVDEAIQAIDLAVGSALADQGLDPSLAHVSWGIEPGFERGSTIEVHVSYPVNVLHAPFLGPVSGPTISVRATHLARVDPYRSRP